jgi:hypothetical protein
MLKSMAQSLCERDRRIAQLEGQVDALIRERFGPCSATTTPSL